MLWYNEHLCPQSCVWSSCAKHLLTLFWRGSRKDRGFKSSWLLGAQFQLFALQSAFQGGSKACVQVGFRIDQFGFDCGRSSYVLLHDSPQILEETSKSSIINNGCHHHSIKARLLLVCIIGAQITICGRVHTPISGFGVNCMLHWSLQHLTTKR